MILGLLNSWSVIVVLLNSWSVFSWTVEMLDMIGYPGFFFRTFKNYFLLQSFTLSPPNSLATASFAAAIAIINIDNPATIGPTIGDCDIGKTDLSDCSFY